MFPSCLSGLEGRTMRTKGARKSRESPSAGAPRSRFGKDKQFALGLTSVSSRSGGAGPSPQPPGAEQGLRRSAAASSEGSSLRLVQAPHWSRGGYTGAIPVSSSSGWRGGGGSPQTPESLLVCWCAVMVTQSTLRRPLLPPPPTPAVLAHIAMETARSHSAVGPDHPGCRKTREQQQEAVGALKSEEAPDPVVPVQPVCSGPSGFPLL